MGNTFFSNIGYYSVGNILPKATSFILLPIYLDYLDPSQYGIVGAMTAMMAFLNIFLTLNFERSIFRLIYDYKDEKDQKRFLGTIFIWILFFATVIVSLLLFFKDYVSNIYDSIDFYPYFFIAIFSVYLNNFGNIPRVYLQVKEKAKVFVILGIIQFLLTNCSILFFVVFLQMKAEGYILGALISSILMLPYFLWFTSKIIVFRFDKTIFKAILKFSLPILPAVIAIQIIDLSDRIFIEKYLTTADLGLYSLAYTIAGVVLVFTASFKKAYDPFFYKIANTYNTKKAKYLLNKTNTLYYLVTILICFSISLVSREIIYIFFDDEYLIVYKIVPILCVAYAISKISGLINLSFYQNKNTKLMMYISIISATLNIILNFLLIPIYGYFGAAYATVFTYLFMLFIKYYFSKREFFIVINFKKILMFCVIVSFIYLISENYLESSIIILFIKFIILFITLLLFYFFEKKNIHEINTYA